MSAAKTTAERVAAMRAARDALGLRRLELYAHPDDWPAIKALAERIQRKRLKAAEKAAISECMECKSPRVVAADKACHRCGCYAWVVRKAP